MTQAPGKPSTDLIMDRFVRNGLAVFAFFLTLNFVAHFLYMGSFGFYGTDDYRLIVPSIYNDPLSIFTHLKDIITDISKGSLGHEGRPIAFTFNLISSNIGMRVGGLIGIYSIALLMATLLSFLTYRVFALKGAHLQGLVAGLFIMLHPALSARPFLTVALGLTLSLIFVLLAIGSYMKGKRLVPYLLVLGSLLTYESLALPFFAVPLLLNEKWDRRLLKRLIVNGVVVSILILAVLALRIGEGDDRVGDLSVQTYEAPLRIAIFMAYGLFISFFYAFYNAFIQTARNIDLTVLATVVSVTGVLMYLLYRLSRRSEGPGNSGSYYYLKLMAAGLVMIILSYATGFYSGYYKYLGEELLSGLYSRVNLPALVGAAVFFSSLYMLIVSKVRGYGGRLIAVLAFALPLGVFAGFGQVVQYDYKKGWEIQQCVWKEIIAKTPDIDDDTLILLKFEGLPALTYTPFNMFSNLGMSRGLTQLFGLPSGWRSHLQLSIKKNEWMERELRFDEDGMKFCLTEIKGYQDIQQFWVPLAQEKLVFFKNDGNNIERFEGTLRINGREIRLKPKPAIDSYARSGCKLSRLMGVEPPKRLDSEPPFVATARFDGANHHKMPSFDRTELKRYTIELWLKPDKNIFDGGVYSDTYPPMPAIIGPLVLSHMSENNMAVTLVTFNEDVKNDSHSVKDILDDDNKGRWLHFELDMDNDKREALLFINGRLEKKFTNIEVPLKGLFMLGRGFLDRFWRGEIADLRISSTIRHTTDFKPESSAVSQDEHTLYLMERL